MLTDINVHLCCVRKKSRPERSNSTKARRHAGDEGYVRWSPEREEAETSNTQLGIRAGGWESSFGDAAWVVVGWGGPGVQRGSPV